MPTTALCTYTNDAIYLRGRSLVDDLIGRMTFTDALYFLIFGREPKAAERRIVDAVLVTLMEHGLTPSAIAARMVYGSGPEALQAGVAAGLLAVASQFVGTMEPAARNLAAIVADPAGADAAAKRLADDYRARREAMPGFGHHLHKPDDPRTPRLIAIAEDACVPGKHIAALRALSREVDRAAGRHITINATGAIAAVLSEIGIEPEIMRGLAVISRAAGLVAHIREEQRDPTLRAVWRAAETAVPHESPAKA
ncbi:MAG: citryl-CoA lyase [Alphaproteobacteria bacterium]|nr:citryl-CoA lyase [Alphaproteobacteria bacterium]